MRPPPPPSCRLTFKVTPGAPRDEIAGTLGDAIRVKLRAPPIEGRANHALIAFVADALGLHASAFQIVTGASARIKLVAITGLAEDDARSRLLRTR